MDLVKNIFFRFSSKSNGKEFIRSNKPYYLKKLKFRYRYPRVFVGGGSALALLFLFSSPIYYTFFKKGPIPPEDLLWREEKLRGKTHKQVWGEHLRQVEKDWAEFWGTKK